VENSLSPRSKIMDAIWYWYLTGEAYNEVDHSIRRNNQIMKMMMLPLPGKPRCLECSTPLGGVGGKVVGLFGLSRASFSPKLCNQCEKFLRKHGGGAEVELSMLFADVRGSTNLAESRPTEEFAGLIRRFYNVSTEVLIEHNALINRLMGDQVIGLFTPRFTGRKHARAAIHSALNLLKALGHASSEGPWVPVGVGVHSGRVYVGSVGSQDQVEEIAVLGNEANLTARLSAHAGAGEVIISAASAANAGLDTGGLEQRILTLKGLSEPVQAYVLRATDSLKLEREIA
jgi:adenylate cyclase